MRNQTRSSRRDGAESLSQPALPTVNRARIKLGASCDEAGYLFFSVRFFSDSTNEVHVLLSLSLPQKKSASVRLT